MKSKGARLSDVYEVSATNVIESYPTCRCRLALVTGNVKEADAFFAMVRDYYSPGVAPDEQEMIHPKKTLVRKIKLNQLDLTQYPTEEGEEFKVWEFRKEIYSRSDEDRPPKLGESVTSYFYATSSQIRKYEKEKTAERNSFNDKCDNLKRYSVNVTEVPKKSKIVRLLKLQQKRFDLEKIIKEAQAELSVVHTGLTMVGPPRLAWKYSDNRIRVPTKNEPSLYE